MGGNAQGKTSLLEAIYFLATATSHRTRSTREMIRRGSESTYIKGVYEDEGRLSTLSVGFAESARRFRHDDAPLARMSDLYGHLRAVFFSPEDLTLVSGSPSLRRRMLDLGLCQKQPEMVRALLAYRKVLKQRNALLRKGDGQPNFAETLRAWDAELVKTGAPIIRKRAEYSLRLMKRTVGHYSELVEAAEELSGVYRATGTHQSWRQASEIPPEEDIEREFLEQLEKNWEKDRLHRATTLGPHRDDLHLLVSDHSAGKYASQGQRRSIALSLKLAERDLLSEGIEPPILLVDDVTHEMDAGRCRRFLEKLAQDGQALLTFTEAEGHPGLSSETPVWNVENGRFSPARVNIS